MIVMTVEELIIALLRMPMDATVGAGNDDTYDDVVRVEQTGQQVRLWIFGEDE